MPDQLNKQFALHVRKHVTTTSLLSSHPGLWWKTALWIFYLSCHFCQPRGHFGEFYTWTIMNWIECSMSWFQDTRKILGCCTHDACLPGHLKLSKIKRSRERSGIPPLPLKKKRILELLHFRSCKGCLLSAVGVQAGALLETGLCWEQIWLHEGGGLV